MSKGPLYILIPLFLISCHQPTVKLKRKAGKLNSSSSSEAFVASSGTPTKGVWLTKEALKQTLSDSFGIPSHELCQEIDKSDCFEDTHLVNIGGNDAETMGRVEGLSSPSLLTPISMERIATITCKNFVQKEQGPDNKRFVFKGINFSQTNYDPKKITVPLGRKLLGRDFNQAEESALTELADGVDAKTFAELTCATIISSTTFLFQ